MARGEPARSHRRRLAVNEGAFGELDAEGRKVALEVQAGEKLSQNFRLEVTNPGGHSSRPLKDNAIYRLSAALLHIEGYEFPAQFTDGSRAYFTGMAKIQAARGNTELPTHARAGQGSDRCTGHRAGLRQGPRAGTRLCAPPCVATMLDAGTRPPNALPQRARANINCRIFPGVSQEAVRAKLEELVADPAVKVTTLETRGPSSPPPPLTPQILAPVEKLAAEFFPGVPVLPILQPGATDGEFLNAGGIPTYGIEPLFAGPDLGHIHGLNEYVSVKSLMDCRDFLYRLIKI